MVSAFINVKVAGPFTYIHAVSVEKKFEGAPSDTTSKGSFFSGIVEQMPLPVKAYVRPSIQQAAIILAKKLSHLIQLSACHY